MLLSKIDPDTLNDDLINKILFNIPKDDKLNGDCIYVFGSRLDMDERVKKAVELYKEKRAPKILFSGGIGLSISKFPESVIMKKKAIKLGVNDKDIIIETESNNTTENVLSSLLILERYFLLQNINRLIIVTTEFHMKRCLLTLSRYMPKWIEYSCAPAYHSIYGHDVWNKTLEGRSKIEKEASDIIFYAKEKYIEDTNIE